MRHAATFITVVLCGTLALSTASAQTDMGLKGAGIELGLVSPENVDATVGFGLFADWGSITPRLFLETYMDYWSKSEGVFGGGETSVRDLAFGARTKYVFRVANPRIHPFAGGGLGIHFLKAEVSVPDQNIGGFIVPGVTVEDTSTKLGMDLGGGMAVNLNERADFLTELWFGIVNDMNQLSLKFGLLYRLGM